MKYQFGAFLLLVCLHSVSAQIIDIQVLPFKFPCPNTPGVMCIFVKEAGEASYTMRFDTIVGLNLQTVVAQSQKIQRTPYPNYYGLPTTDRVVSANPSNPWPPSPIPTPPPLPTPPQPSALSFARDWKITTIYSIVVQHSTASLLIMNSGLVLEYCHTVRGTYNIMGNTISLKF